MKQWEVRCDGFLGKIHREFDTAEQAALWAAQIGRPDAVILYRPDAQARDLRRAAALLKLAPFNCSERPVPLGD